MRGPQSMNAEGIWQLAEKCLGGAPGNPGGNWHRGAGGRLWGLGRRRISRL